jgi:hypothetical protein
MLDRNIPEGYASEVAWEVVLTDECRDWYFGLGDKQRAALIARVDLVAEEGPNLGRPTVDSIETSRHHNMKELRVSKEGELRVLFVFDPLRQAVLLLGGDKTGAWNDWYRWAIPRADDLYDEYLDELRREGLLK